MAWYDDFLDKCDICGRVADPGDFLHGVLLETDAGLPGYEVGDWADICQSCQHKVNLTNCSRCDALFGNGGWNETYDYMCDECLEKETRPTGQEVT